MNFSRLFGRKAILPLAATACLLVLTGCGDSDGKKAYAEGEAAFDIRDFSRAARAFAKSIELNRENVDTWMMLSRSHYAMGDIPAARRAIDEASARAPNDVDVIELAAQLSYCAKDFAKMRALFSRLASATNEPAIRSRGLCGLAIADLATLSGSQMNENRARAHVRLLEALRADARQASARYHLGRLYRDVFDYREAALDQFELFVRLETRESERVQRVQRRVIPELKESVARAAAAMPGADRRNSSTSAAHLKKAEDAFAKGKFKQAKQSYVEAIQADVLSFPATLGLAKCCEKVDTSKSGLREALKYYRLAAQLRPSSRDTLLLVGDRAMKLGNSATAVEAYSRALVTRPNDITAIDGLIRALQKAGDAKSAAVYQTYRENLPKRTR